MVLLKLSSLVNIVIVGTGRRPAYRVRGKRGKERKGEPRVLATRKFSQIEVHALPTHVLRSILVGRGSGVKAKRDESTLGFTRLDFGYASR